MSDAQEQPKDQAPPPAESAASQPGRNDTRAVESMVERGLISRELAEQVLKRASAEASAVDLLIREGHVTGPMIERLLDAERKDPSQIADFKVLGKLGAGGMATVYKAVQQRMGRQVALKVIDPQFAANKEFCERFIREARVAGQINHPNVITCHDVGQDRGWLYMALELVTGGDAAQVAHQEGGKLSEARALRVIMDATRGLSALARAGLIHRDIKPANIFITEDGVAKLADLGLARPSADSERMTNAGMPVGTPAYMSPEQAAGDEAVDHRSDVYALGATLFALLTGQSPFAGANALAVLAQVQRDAVPDPRRLNPEVSDATAAIVFKAMAKNRDDRYAGSEDLLEDLRLAAAGRPLRHAAIIPASRWPRRGETQRAPAPIAAPPAAAAAPAALDAQTLVANLGAPTTAPPRRTVDWTRRVSSTLVGQNELAADHERHQLLPWIIISVSAGALAAALLVTFWPRGEEASPAPAVEVAHQPTAPGERTSATTLAPAIDARAPAQPEVAAHGDATAPVAPRADAAPATPIDATAHDVVAAAEPSADAGAAQAADAHRDAPSGSTRAAADAAVARAPAEPAAALADAASIATAADTTKAADPIARVDPTKAADPATAADAATTAGAAKAADAPKASDTATTAGPAKAADATKASDTAKPVDPAVAASTTAKVADAATTTSAHAVAHDVPDAAHGDVATATAAVRADAAAASDTARADATTAADTAHRDAAKPDPAHADASAPSAVAHADAEAADATSAKPADAAATPDARTAAATTAVTDTAAALGIADPPTAARAAAPAAHADAPADAESLRAAAVDPAAHEPTPQEAVAATWQRYLDEQHFRCTVRATPTGIEVIDVARDTRDLSPLMAVPMESLDLAGCERLDGDLAPLAGKPATTLRSLNLAGCKRLRRLDGLERIPLERLNLTGCAALGGDLSALGAARIAKLECAGCESLRSIGGVDRAPLTEVDLSDCKALKGDLSPLAGKPIRRLAITGCSSLQGLHGIEGAPLTRLDLRGCERLEGDLSALDGMRLERVDLIGCESLEGLHGIEALRLTDLNLTGCRKLKGDLAVLRGMPLTRLYLVDCRRLASLHGIEGMALTDLDLGNCESLRGDLGVLRGMPLKRLSLAGCKDLTSLDGLQGMQLTELDLSYCASLGPDLAPLAGTPLTQLNLTRCSSLVSLHGIERMPLHRLVLTRTSRLEDKTALATIRDVEVEK